MSGCTQYYHRELIRTTVGPPSEAVTVNPTKIFWSFKRLLDYLLLPSYLAWMPLKQRAPCIQHQQLCFRYLLVLSSTVGVVNENVTIVCVRLVLCHQGRLRPVWSNRRKCLLPDSALSAKYSQFHRCTRTINALGCMDAQNTIILTLNYDINVKLTT